jgi:hypothetical protein
MLYSNTLNEIATNINTGVEYEIALFYQLSSPENRSLILPVINKRADKNKINNIGNTLIEGTNLLASTLSNNTVITMSSKIKTIRC